MKVKIETLDIRALFAGRHNPNMTQYYLKMASEIPDSIKQKNSKLLEALLKEITNSEEK